MQVSVPRQPPRVLTTAPPTVAPRGAEPIDVLNAERVSAGADVLLGIADSKPNSRSAAIRAIGRLEDYSLVPRLMNFGASIDTAGAIAQSLQGFDPAADPALIQQVWAWMGADGDLADARMQPEKVAAIAMPMASIRYANAEQVAAIEHQLAAVADATANDLVHAPQYNGAIHGLEALARVNTRLVHFDDETARVLGNSVRNTAVNDDPAQTRLYAFLALVSGRALEPAVLRKALTDDEWQIRRGAMQIVAGTGGNLDEIQRPGLIQAALHDSSPHVRYEVLRAYARHSAATLGCQPLLDALTDDDTTVALAAIDALGEQCKDSDDVTMRVTAEVRTPPNWPWQREAHAFLALAKRSPERAAVVTETFTTHDNPWVRRYAVLATAAAKDLLHLDKLAYDSDDNVREAALTAMAPLDRDRAVRAAVDSLQQRADVQLLRAAAILVKEQPAAPVRYYAALLAALQTLTKDGRMTSRDARLEILTAVEKHAKADKYTDLAPWLKDFDPQVAHSAARVMSHLSGKSLTADPQPRTLPAWTDVDNLQQCVAIEMDGDQTITMRLLAGIADVTAERFLTLATKDHYYDGTSFHRVVPNFVIQGGSPGGNEYSGSRDYMRDEVAASNVRGTVGLSTRGRNTGDAQFFINLVDNPRLNGLYTVFAVVNDADLAKVDAVQEGRKIVRIRTTTCGLPRR